MSPLNIDNIKQLNGFWTIDAQLAHQMSWWCLAWLTWSDSDSTNQ